MWSRRYISESRLWIEADLKREMNQAKSRIGWPSRIWLIQKLRRGSVLRNWGNEKVNDLYGDLQKIKRAIKQDGGVMVREWPVANGYNECTNFSSEPLSAISLNQKVGPHERAFPNIRRYNRKDWYPVRYEYYGGIYIQSSCSYCIA